MIAYVRRLPAHVGVLFLISILLLVNATQHIATYNAAGVDVDLQNWLYEAALACAALACFERARLRQAERRAWLLLASGLALWLGGDVYWALALAELESPPYPSLADALWLGSYVPLVLGLGLLARARVGAVPRILRLDAVIAALVLAAISAGLVVNAVADASEGADTATLVTNLAYPTADMVLLALLVAMIAANGWRIGRSWAPLVAGLALLGIADSIYAYQVAAGTYGAWEYVDLLWIVAFIALAAGAWQEPPGRVAVPLVRRRLEVVPAALSSAMLAVLVADHFVAAHPLTVLLAGLVLGAAIVRMTLVVGALDRANAKLDEARRDAEERSRIDPLTGLLNRRELGHRARSALRAAGGGEVSIAVVDIDHFKLVNDRHGHPAGDRVLMEIAARIRRAVGPDDHVGRWGGEEFCLLLTGIQGVAELRARCERIRLAVCSRPIPLGAARGTRVTCSVGAARAAGANDEELEHLLHRSDRALYAAKQAGRNRTVLHGDAARLQPLQESDEVRLARSLAIATSLHDDASAMHWHQVSDLAAATARRLGLPGDVVHRCEIGGLVHDIGKVALPGSLLTKPGPLDGPEWAAVRAHSEIGEALAREGSLFAGVADIVRHHHERVDGSGYPDGLRGPEIPIEARIVAACDAYAAMTAERTYGPARTQDEAVSELRRSAGTHLDPDVVAALVDVLDARREAAARHFARSAAA